jgi:hypothetical protein
MREAGVGQSWSKPGWGKIMKIKSNIKAKGGAAQASAMP